MSSTGWEPLNEKEKSFITRKPDDLREGGNFRNWKRKNILN